MTDIVDELKDEELRLGHKSHQWVCGGPDCGMASSVAMRAAAEITRLREIERLARECRKAQKSAAKARVRYNASDSEVDFERHMDAGLAMDAAESALDAALGE